MADREEEEVGIPQFRFTEYENTEIELVTEADLAKEAEGEFSGKSREELIAEVRAAKLAAATREQGNGGLEAEVQTLRQGLQSSVSMEQLRAIAALNQPQQQPQQKRESDAEFAARIKEQLFENPVESMKEIVGRQIAPEVQRLAANNMHWSQKSLEANPNLSVVFTKYRAEIDAEVQKASPQDRLYDPEIYEKAAQRVTANHITDIINERVQEALGGKGPAPGKPNPSVAYSETGMSIPAPGAKTKVKLKTTPEDERQAMIRGVKIVDYMAVKARKEGLI